MKYLLDTNVLSYYLRKQFPPLIAKFTQGALEQTIAISVIVRAEALHGAALLSTDDKRRAAIHALVDDIPTLAWDKQHADRYAHINAELTRSGQSIGMADAMIAAHALVENLILVTHNVKHFERVSNLKIEDWTQSS